jgi:hypothetical protein
MSPSALRKSTVASSASPRADDHVRRRRRRPRIRVVARPHDRRDGRAAVAEASAAVRLERIGRARALGRDQERHALLVVRLAGPLALRDRILGVEANHELIFARWRVGGRGHRGQQRRDLAGRQAGTSTSPRRLPGPGRLTRATRWISAEQAPRPAPPPTLRVSNSTLTKPPAPTLGAAERPRGRRLAVSPRRERAEQTRRRPTTTSA